MIIAYGILIGSIITLLALLVEAPSFNKRIRNGEEPLYTKEDNVIGLVSYLLILISCQYIWG